MIGEFFYPTDRWVCDELTHNHVTTGSAIGFSPICFSSAVSAISAVRQCLSSLQT
jgi:hypothetical protein